jgi:hypothetical protein
MKRATNDLQETLFGRKERHNPEGKGPNGKVFDDPGTSKNKSQGDHQVEDYKNPNASNPASPNYNPQYYNIQPKVEEKPQDPNNPDSEIQVKGKVSYDPIGKPQGLQEDPESKRRRIEEDKHKHQKQLEEIQKRNDTTDVEKQMKDKTQRVNNDLTNNKPQNAPQPKNDGGQAYQTPGTANNSIRPTPPPANFDWGEAPKKVEGLVLKFEPVFDDETAADRTMYSSHEAIMQNSKWREMHEKIDGEFYDKDFPAEVKSLVGNANYKEQADLKKIETMKTYSFKRLSYMIEDLQVISDGISPSDIFQGQLGDCYFLSALASIAEVGKRLERNLFQRSKSPNGAYCIALNISGCWVPVVIDDIFPVRPDGQLPFCYTKHKEIWAMLLEKAYAKIYGAYWHIGNGGLSANALRDVTGAPCHYIDLKDAKEAESAMKAVSEADGKGYIINCSSKGQGETKNAKGIIAGHAYTLAGVVNLSNRTTLLKLRNPWGKGEWTGNWGDSSPLWNGKLKDEAGLVSGDDGVFFMTFEDFKDNFDGIVICHYRDEFIYSYVKSTNPDEAIDGKQFTVNAAGEYYIGLSQPDKNMFTHDPNYDYGFMSCLIAKKEGDKFVYVDGFSNANRDPWAKMQLQPGNYAAFIYTNWKSTNTSYTFWAYGPKNITIRDVVQPQNKAKFVQIIADVLQAKALSDDGTWSKFKDGRLDKARYRFEHCSNGYGYYIFDNHVEGLTLNATLNKTSTGCEFIYPTDAKGNQHPLQISSTETKIVVYQVQGLPNSINFQVGFKMSLSRA